MLSYSLLKNDAGILLVGYHTSLSWLHAVLHEVNDRPPIVIDKEGSFLRLAYDVRKALEAVIEDALREDFGAQAERVIGLWQRLDPAQAEVFGMIDSRGGSSVHGRRSNGNLALRSSFQALMRCMTASTLCD
jgi:hypothetical protein